MSQPDLAPENELVIRVWNFCGGWSPALIGAAAAYYGIEDVDGLIEQLLALRDCQQERQRALQAGLDGGA